MAEGEAFFISDVQSGVLSIEVHLDYGAVVVDDMVGVEIGPRSFGEDPSIIDLKLGISGIISISRALNDQVTIIHEDLLHITVLHK